MGVKIPKNKGVTGKFVNGPVFLPVWIVSNITGRIREPVTGSLSCPVSFWIQGMICA